LDRQRDAVKPPADLQHGRHVDIVEHEAAGGGGPFVEQLNSRISQRLGGSRAGFSFWRKL
jgi:hypothetical protein